MYVEFGTYRHRINSVGTQIDKTPVEDYRGEAFAVMHRWTLDFRLIGTTPAALDAEIVLLEAAYSAPQTSVKLLYADASPTSTAILPGTTIGPVRVVKPPSYMRYQNGEYVTYRTGQIVLEAMVKLTNDPFRVLEFSESVDTEASGTEYVFLQPNVGPAIQQVARTQLKSTATQSGRIVHMGARGPIPPALWPDAQMRPVKIRKESPRRIGSTLWSFATSYTYTFESASTLSGEPTAFV